MSSTENIQNVHERILKIAQQLEGLSRSDVPPDQFFPEFLKLLMSALGAQAGAVWLRDANNRLNLSHEIGLSETGFLDNPQANSLNQTLLSNVIATGEAASYSPQDELDTKLPTDNLHILAALQVENEGVGVVQIFQRADSPADARPGFLQFVEQMCGYASRYLEQRESVEAALTPAEFESKEELRNKWVVLSGVLFAVLFTLSFALYAFAVPTSGTRDVIKYDQIHLTSSAGGVRTVERVETVRFEMTPESRLRFYMIIGVACLLGVSYACVCGVYFRELWKGNNPKKHLRDLVDRGFIALIGVVFGFIASGDYEEREIPIKLDQATQTPSESNSGPVPKVYDEISPLGTPSAGETEQQEDAPGFGPTRTLEDEKTSDTDLKPKPEGE